MNASPFISVKARYPILFLLLAIAAACTNQPVRPSEKCTDIPATPTYAANVEPILTTYCVGCHNAAAPLAGINLEGYAAASDYVLNNPDIFLAAIRHESPQTSKWMPQNGPKLPRCTLLTLERWVTTGAQP